MREPVGGAGAALWGRVADFRLLDRDGGQGARLRAVVHDPESFRSVQVVGRLGVLGQAEVSATPYRPLPGGEEFARAVKAVRPHAYRPMPPPADIEKSGRNHRPGGHRGVA